MTTRLARLTHGLTGAILTVLLLAGPPWLLTTYVGPPIPTSWPDLDTLRAIATTGVTDTFAITTLAVIIWIAWAQLALAITAELIAAVRHRPAIHLPLLPGTRPLAARLVAATLLLVTVLQPRPVATATQLDLAVVSAPASIPDHQPAAAPISPVTARTAVEIPTRTIQVTQRDSWWSLAETHLNDGIRWRELRDLNLNRTLQDGTVVRASTDQLQPGWDLLVPADSTTADTARTAPAPATDDDQPDIATDWKVTPGEHFWGKAADTLKQAWDRPPTDREIVPYWQQLIDTNRDQLAPPHNPDLIHPGQRFEIPTPPPDPNGAPPAATPHPDIEPDLELDSAGDDPEPEVDHAAPDLDEPGAGPAAPDEPDETAPAVPARPDHLTLNLVPDQTAPNVDDTSDGTSPARTILGIPAELSGAAAGTALAAAGIVALLARRRRTALQQRATTLRLPTPAPAFVDHLGGLAAAAPADPVLDEVVDLLSTIPEELHPALVLLHDSGPISLVFDDDATPTAPPAPWVLDTDDGGPVRWTARLGSRGPRRSIGLPLLLTLGRTETTTVLANLAALGTLPVTGPADQVRTRLRAATLELACSRTAGPLEVVVIGDDHHLDVEQLRYTDSPDETIAALADDAEQGIIADDRLPRAIICHDPHRTIGIPPAAVGFGAVLIAADSPTGSWRLDLDGPTTWLHLPGGHRHELTSPDLRPDLIADELDRLDLDNAVPAPPAPTDPDPDPGPDEDVIVVRDPDSPPSDVLWCHIGLLGPLQVTLGDQPLTRLTPTVRQLLPYLATHRHGVTLARLEETIWPGRPGSPNGQRTRTALTRLRAELGDAPDGTPLIPRRGTGDQPIRLSDHVTTDLDQALQHLDTARTGDPDRQLHHLLAALDLIRGEPFEDLCFSWTLDVQQHAITHLHDAALTAAERLRQLGRHDEAEHAIRQGLTLYDPSEPLYVEWFHLEHARGNPERIPHLWRRLQQRYADQADETAGVITSPTIETELAYTNLTRNRPA